jgi:hypothetical protein
LNKRKEDRLIQMAFGEFGAEIGTPEKEADRKMLETYSTLRKSLVEARDIPDHQLSNERLRHAILGEGLHQAKTKTEADLGWLWNSLGICGIVAVFVLVLGRRAHSPTPEVNLKALDQVATRDFQFSHTPAQLMPLAKTHVLHTISKAAGGYRVAEYTGEAAHTVRKGRAHKQDSILKEHKSASDLMAFQAPIDEEDSVGYSTVSNPSTRATGAPVGAVDGRTETKSETKKPGQDAVVEIDQDQDDNTGARAAREIASKDVVVGG